MAIFLDLPADFLAALGADFLPFDADLEADFFPPFLGLAGDLGLAGEAGAAGAAFATLAGLAAGLAAFLAGLAALAGFDLEAFETLAALGLEADFLD